MVFRFKCYNLPFFGWWDVRSMSDDRVIIKKYSRHFLIAVVLFVGCNITSCDTDIVSRDIFIINKMESRQVDGFCHF